MPNPYFSFKLFTVFHDKCAMKVGIDGVLLGAWANVEYTETILDIGTGSGLIALMLAQRSNAQLTAIDIDQNAVLQATENIKNSSWSERISVIQNSFQEFSALSTECYDLIVSNPPYFVDSLKTPYESRTTARHADSLTHEELIENAIQLLNPTGKICIILPVNEGENCIEFAEKKGLFCSKKVIVFPKPDSKPKRLLLEFKMGNAEMETSELVIESEVRHRYSPEFTELAKDYYLKL